jgi:hypothetical protein
MHIVVLCKRQYTNRDVIDDRYGRLWEIPAELAKARHRVTCVSFNSATRDVVDKTLELGGAAGDMSAHRGGDIMFQALKEHGGELQGVHIAVAGS